MGETRRVGPCGREAFKGFQFASGLSKKESYDELAVSARAQGEEGSSDLLSLGKHVIQKSEWRHQKGIMAYDLPGAIGIALHFTSSHGTYKIAISVSQSWSNIVTLTRFKLPLYGFSHLPDLKDLLRTCLMSQSW